MKRPKIPEKGRILFPIGVFTGISLWIWFARLKHPITPHSLTTSITEVLEQEEETEERDETALLESIIFLVLESFFGSRIRGKESDINYLNPSLIKFYFFVART